MPHLDVICTWVNLKLNIEVEIIMGVLAVLVGLGLAFAQVNASELRKKTHTNPGMALFRFRLWRFGMAIVSFVAGLLIIYNALSS